MSHHCLKHFMAQTHSMSHTHITTNTGSRKRAQAPHIATARAQHTPGNVEYHTSSHHSVCLQAADQTAGTASAVSVSDPSMEQYLTSEECARPAVRLSQVPYCTCSQRAPWKPALSMLAYKATKKKRTILRPCAHLLSSLMVCLSQVHQEAILVPAATSLYLP